MTLYEAVIKTINRWEYGDENATSPSAFFVTDYVDRMTHSEFLHLLSKALERMKEDAGKSQ